MLSNARVKASRALGHASAAMTLDVYSGLLMTISMGWRHVSTRNATRLPPENPEGR
jgi:integrase